MSTEQEAKGPTLIDRLFESRSVALRSRRLKMMFGAALIYAGGGLVALVLLEDTARPFAYLVERYDLVGPKGVILLIATALVAWGLYVAVGTLRYSPRFIDVDDAARNAREHSRWYAPSDFRDGGRDVRQEAEVEELPEVPGGNAPTPPPQEPLSFESYFGDIRKLLEEKVAAADQKASILLDKGTAYAGWGILFFVISVVIWQALAWHSGFQQQHIFGIVSTSFLFLFIEFLSAWFLRQYRHFVDTSTYLIKVKSLFDRYMLVHLAGAEALASGTEAKAVTRQLLDLLGREISWPDTYLTKKADVGFARDALEAMSLFAKGLKEQAQATASSSDRQRGAASSAEK